jgi:hypothetical protein
MTLQHIVLFSFPEEPSAEDATDMRNHILGWCGVIPNIRTIRFGRDITGARTRGYQYLLYMEVADIPALQAYQQHPVHQKFLRWVLDRDCTPLAFDYHLDESTVVL